MQEYFGIFQKRISNQLQIPFSSPNNYAKEEPIHVFSELSVNTIEPDYICNRSLFRCCHLFSNPFKNLLSSYEPEIYFNPIFVTDQKSGRQVLYWKMENEPFPCLQSLLTGQKKLTQLIDRHFWIGKMEKTEILIVDLYLLESILRRNPIGISFEQLILAIK